MSAPALVFLSSRLHSPAAPMAFGPGGDVSWETFCGQTAALRDEVLARGPSEWVLCFDDCYHFAVAFCAVLSAGKAVLLPGNVQPEAVAALAAPGRGYLHDGDAAPAFAAVLSLPVPEHQVREATFAVEDVDRLSITLLTSGSTGQPKPVRKSVANLLTEVAALEKTWGVNVRRARVVATVTHRHIYGLLFRVLWPLWAGNPFDRRDLSFPEEAVAQAGPDAVLISSPAILKRVMGQATGAYRAIFSSGGLLPYAAATGSQQVLGCLPIEVFGSTETGGIGWRRQAGPDTPWTLLPGVEAVGGGDQALLVRTTFVTSAVPLATGDAVCLVGDRQFTWLGRMDRIVKIAEKRIALAEVEARLTQLDWVEEATALALGAPDRTVLGAVVVLTLAGRGALEELGTGRFRLQLRKTLRRWLEPAAVPRRYREVDALPLNTQGKLVQGALHALFEK